MENYQLTDEVINLMLKAAAKAAETDQKSKDFYMFKSVENLYNMALKSNSLGKFREEVPVRALRVIKCKRPIPREVLMAMDRMKTDDGMYERVFCSGLYITVPVVHIPKDVLQNECIIPCTKGILYTTKAPSIQSLNVDVVESTLHINSDGSALVLERCPITDWITLGTHYQPLEIY